MTNKPTPQDQYSGDTDVLELFKYFERGLMKIVNFIGSIFKFIFSAIIYTLKAILLNIKVIAVVVVLAGIGGYVLEKISPKKYDSTMLVRTYFDAKYQLLTNINYYNALLEDENYQTLQDIFELDEERVRQILEFEMRAGPETENEKLVAYDRFVKGIDSIMAADISYEEFIENRGILSGNLFEITVVSNDKNLFKHLEEGIEKSFNNLYSIKKMETRDSLIAIQKTNLRAALVEIDSLQKVYIDVLENESQSTKAKINLGDGFPLQQEKSETKEYQLLNKEIELRNELRALDEKKIEENVFFDVISSFQEVGNVKKEWTDYYSLIFPALAFLGLCLIFIFNRLTQFVKEYEG